jgi:hypothetical protein
MHSKIEETVSKQRIGKHKTIGVCWKRCFLFAPCKVIMLRESVENWQSIVELREDKWEEIAVAAENLIESSGVGSCSCQMMEESSEFSWELKVRQRREDFTYAIVQQYLECVIWWDCYSSCVKIRCQKTDSGDCNRLRTLVFEAMNWKVRRIAAALKSRVVSTAVYK